MQAGADTARDTMVLTTLAGTSLKRPVRSPREAKVTEKYMEAAGCGQSRSRAVQATCGQHKATLTART